MKFYEYDPKTKKMIAHEKPTQDHFDKMPEDQIPAKFKKKTTTKKSK